MTNTLCIIAPEALLSPSDYVATLTTPYDTVSHYSKDYCTWLLPASPHALIYAAKKMGATHVIEVLPLQAINRLLEPNDIVLPNDLLDMTHGYCSTFFVGKGYGFLPQNSPYCPILRTTLLNAAQHIAISTPLHARPRIFQRATYAALDKDSRFDRLTQDILCYGGNAGIDVVGTHGIPTSFLARELELCYAPLGYITSCHVYHPSATVQTTTETESQLHALLHRILQHTYHHIPTERTCPCAYAMQAVRQRGLVDEDWTTWIGHM